MSNVQYLTPKRSIGELNRAARRSSSAQAVAEIMFVKMAQEQQLDETTISEYPDLFTPWDENWRGKAGDIVQDEGQLYRSIHDVKDAGQNTKPSATPSMWTRIGNPLEEFPEWIQPIGAHDAYDQGAKVTHNGKRWVSSAASNVWEPGVYGWEEYQEPEPAQEAPRKPRTGPGSRGQPATHNENGPGGRRVPLLRGPYNARPPAGAAPHSGGRRRKRAGLELLLRNPLFFLIFAVRVSQKFCRATLWLAWQF